MDQAAGLRRLFARDALRAFTFASARTGVGKTVLVAGVAAALARSGREVLVIDENAGPGNVAAAFGLRGRHDLLDVLRGEKGLAEVLVGAGGVSILPAARAAAVRAAAPGQAWNAERLGALERPFEFVLVDTAVASASRMLPVGLASNETVVVTRGGTEALKDSYALVKRMRTEYGARRFRLAVTQVGDAGAARGIHANLAAVARGYLGVELGYLGDVARDPCAKRAAELGRPVVELFPESPAAAGVRAAAERLAGHGATEEVPRELGTFMERMVAAIRLAPAMGL